ncbi:hypothetical protein B0H19DRAFT_1140538 [Mycena capillaripes]|nr:hypothetical protein B0H19DRAFT_1140538 [Mycena capillaripes]
MLLSTLASFAFAVAFVRAQTVPVTKIVNIQDFKANVFDLANGNASELIPVQTLTHKTGVTAQQWLIEAGIAPGLFTIQNIAAGTFLSSTGAIAQLNPIATQLCGHERAFQWNITVNGNKFNIIEPKSGFAATSWAFSTSTIIGQTTPVTLQNYDPAAAQQLFSLPACELFLRLWAMFLLLTVIQLLELLRSLC